MDLGEAIEVAIDVQESFLENPYTDKKWLEKIDKAQSILLNFRTLLVRESQEEE